MKISRLTRLVSRSDTKNLENESSSPHFRFIKYIVVDLFFGTVAVQVFSLIFGEQIIEQLMIFFEEKEDILTFSINLPVISSI